MTRTDVEIGVVGRHGRIGPVTIVTCCKPATSSTTGLGTLEQGIARELGMPVADDNDGKGSRSGLRSLPRGVLVYIPILGKPYRIEVRMAYCG